MNREKIFTQLLFYFLVMMFLMVIGCVIKEATYTISGAVTKYGTNDAFANVTVKLTGAADASTTTDANGDFSFTDQENGTYTVIPSFTNYTFNPVSTVVVVSEANITDINFVATSTSGADTFSISGKVTGDVLAGVKITLGGDTQKGTAVTATDGTYIFENLVDGGDYTVTPSLTGYTFTPTKMDVILSGANVTDMNFTAVK